MANRKTQKKRDREKAKKINASNPKLIKMEGGSSNGNAETRIGVSRGASIPSGESFGD